MNQKFKPYLDAARAGIAFQDNEMADAMRLIMDGGVDEESLAAFLTALAKRGETAAEIAGAARILREKSHTIQAPPGAVDCCGTGGDGIGTYNISTAVALVAASCGVPVAKHGNRSASSKSGAADVLEALGVRLDLPFPRLEEALNTLNFVFLMAPQHHAAMHHVIPVRRRLGFRTIFNLLGPLANPAGTRLQLVGVYDSRWLRPMAEALCSLGADKAWIVHGRDGLDEISIGGPTDIAVLEHTSIESGILTPDDFGLSSSPVETLKGGDAAENAKAMLELLQGRHSPYRDSVIANCAALLTLSGKTNDLISGARMAADAIDAGKAADTLKRYIAFTQKASKA